MAFFFGPLHTTESSLRFRRNPTLMQASRASDPSAYTGTQPSLLCTIPFPSRPSIRGIEGPVRSTSRMPTRGDEEDACKDSASWAETDDLPTPPLPERTMMMCLTVLSLRDTGVSCALVMMWNETSVCTRDDAEFSSRNSPPSSSLRLTQPLSDIRVTEGSGMCHVVISDASRR
jgi:hypothetical protein